MLWVFSYAYVQCGTFGNPDIHFVYPCYPQVELVSRANTGRSLLWFYIGNEKSPNQLLMRHIKLNTG